MARFEVKSGIDQLTNDTSKLAEMTDEDKYSILEAGAKVLTDKLRAVLHRLGLFETGRLAESIKAVHKDDGEKFVLVYPKGKHHTYTSRDGKQKSATAAEVGFVLEYGSPGSGIKAYHWQETGIKEAEGDVSTAMQDAFNDIVDSKLS